MGIHHKQYHCRRCHAGAADFAGVGATLHYPPDLLLEPRHLDIALRVDIEGRSAAGVVTTRVEARADGTHALTLDAVDFLDVSVSDPWGAEVRWRYDGLKLVVTWLAPWKVGESRELAVAYRVVEPVSGLFFSAPSEAFPDAPRFAATDHETERARHWLPCIDLPTVRQSLAFHLTVAEGLTALANGEKVGEQANGDGTVTVDWRLDQRCPSYITCFAVGEFVSVDGGEFDGKPLAYFASPYHAPEDLERSFGRTGKMLAWMTERLGHPLPWPKYYQFALPGIGGAMENISLVSWDDVFVMDATLAREWTWLVDQINVHEMAHTWFGDMVVCRDFAHAWLKESWATYMETCWLEDTEGADEQCYNLYRDAEAYFGEADDRYMRPLVTRQFRTSWQMYDAHLYPGGACRLHTLRCELGDAAFWAAVQDYLHSHAFGVVETEDFRRMMEKHSGRSLGRFFDQWIYGAGYPKIELEFSYDDDARQGRFVITQAQVAADKEDEGTVFHLSTDLAWTIDGVTETCPVRLDRRVVNVTVPMAKDPAMVRFDPGQKILHKLTFKAGRPKLVHQLEHAPDVAGRAIAAHALAELGTRAAVEALVAQYAREPFWGVRRELAKALSAIPLSAAVEALASIVRDEKDDMVLDGVFRVLGDLRESGLREAIGARLDAGDLGYWATAFALEALGSQRDAAPWERLVEAAGTTGFAGIVQSGALRALSKTHRQEAAALLREKLVPGAIDRRARRAAVAALGDVARSVDDREKDRCREALEDRLRDADATVRLAAVNALGAMKATGSIEAIEALRGQLPAQQQVGLDDVVTGLRASGDSAVAALQTRFEKLEERYRKLNDHVQELEARIDPKKPDA